MDTTTIRSRVYHGGICLLLSVACAFSIIPSQSEAARFPEVGASFLAEREQAGSSRVRRLQEFSDRTDAVGYLNADGSKTVYIYAEDVRYRDKNGTVIDKNIHLTEDTAQDRAGGGYRYRTAANDITAYYPERLSNDGVTWEYNGHRIALWPQGDGTSVVALEQDNTRAVYQTASGKIAFDSILSGTRLSQTVDADATAVTMAADFGDLTPRVEQNTISLVDVAGKEQLRFESLNLTDEDGNNSEALILSLTPKTDGKYSVSIDLDEEFVSVADSAVMLNASLTVSSSSNIISASVYSGAPTTNYGSQTYNRIGYDWDSSPSKGFARTYVKFDLSALSNIRYDNITSACYRFTEGSSADVTAVMEAYLVTNSWNESTITWNNKPDYYGEEALAKININSAVNESQYDLYITKAVQGWLQGLNNYGLLLKEKEDYQWQSFFSEEFPTSTIAPSLVITYVDEAAPTQAPGVEDGGTYYLLNKKSGKYLAAAGTTAGSYATEDDSVAIAQKVWTVEQQTNGYYTLKNNGLALQATGATAGISVKVQTASATAPRQHWAIARNWDGSYRLINQFGQSQDLCLSGGSSTNGTYTRVQVYTVNLDGADDWTLVPTNKGNTSILYDSIMWEDEGSEYHMNILRQSISNMISYSNSLGYNATRCDDKTTSEALELMHNSSIWVATGHGSKSSQQISKIKQSFIYIVLRMLLH